MDAKIVQVALNGIQNILQLGEQEAKTTFGVNPYAVLVEECYGKPIHTLFWYVCVFNILFHITIICHITKWLYMNTPNVELGYSSVQQKVVGMWRQDSEMNQALLLTKKLHKVGWGGGNPNY